jgi:hypothetical protein
VGDGTSEQDDMLAGLRPELGEDPDLREALKKARARRNAKDPDYVAKQLDGVIAPKPFLSPEHYHISYECQGFTYPDTQRRWSKSRLAALQIWKMQALSQGEPIFWDDGAVTIWTVLKGRTGVHQVTLRTVECFLKGCGRAATIVEPVLDGIIEMPEYKPEEIIAKPDRPARRKGGRLILPGDS